MVSVRRGFVRAPSVSSFVWFAAILAIFSFAVLLFGIPGGGINAFSSEASKAGDAKQQQSKFFSLLVELQFVDEAAKKTFLQEIAPLAEYVEKNEEDTLAYQVLQSDKDPLHVLMMERYADKEYAYLRVHKQSTAFVAFRPKLQAMQDANQVTITGHSYADTRVGFSHRVGVTSAETRDGVGGGEQ